MNKATKVRYQIKLKEEKFSRCQWVNKLNSKQELLNLPVNFYKFLHDNFVGMCYILQEFSMVFLPEKVFCSVLF